MGSASASEFDVFKVFKDYEVDYCIATGEVEDNKIIVNCRLSLELDITLDEPIDVRDTIEEEKDLAEFVDVINEAVESQTTIIPEPEVTPWDKQGVTKETWELLKEKEIEQQGIKSKVLEDCEGGEGQSRAFQTPWHIKDIMSAVESIEDWANLTTADRKLIAECGAIDITYQLGYDYYPGLEIEEFEGFVVANTDRLRIGIYATSEDLDSEEAAAMKVIRESPWMSGLDPDEKPYPNLDEAVMTEQRSTAEQARESVELGEDIEEETYLAWKEICKNAWENVGGATNATATMAITTWPGPLMDGTCDEFVEGLEAQRTSDANQALLKPNQNAVNCPDCEEYW